jgi:hypothetical protein
MGNFTYTAIDKEMVPNLTFTKELEIEQDDDLRSRLERATLLGNIHHSKVTIYFHDDEGPKKVETTIWATGTKFICLKGGMWIPISRITDVDYNS